MEMTRVCEFLKEAQTYYLATEDGGRPRVRPFGTAHIFEKRLYILTGKRKDISRQFAANGSVELCAVKGEEWLRLTGTLVEDDRAEARQSMLHEYPSLQFLSGADDGSAQVFYFKDATAAFCSFTHEPENIRL